MDNHERFQSPDQQGNADVCLAKEQRIATLSSLVCELMRENQELRQVLSETGAGGHHKDRLPWKRKIES